MKAVAGKANGAGAHTYQFLFWGGSMEEEWLYLPLIGCRSPDSHDGADERPVTPQVMGRSGAVMAWMAAVRFEPIRGAEQISRPIDCFPLCPKILFMQPAGSRPTQC